MTTINYNLPPYAIPPNFNAGSSTRTQLQDLSKTPNVATPFYIENAIIAGVFYDTLAQQPCYYQYKSLNGFYSIWCDPDAVAKNDHTFQLVETVLQPNSSYTPPTNSSAALLKTIQANITNSQTTINALQSAIASIQTNITALQTNQNAMMNSLTAFGLGTVTNGVYTVATGTMPTTAKIITNWNNIQTINSTMNSNVTKLNTNVDNYNGLNTLNLAANSNAKMTKLSTLTIAT